MSELGELKATEDTLAARTADERALLRAVAEFLNAFEVSVPIDRSDRHGTC